MQQKTKIVIGVSIIVIIAGLVFAWFKMEDKKRNASQIESRIGQQKTVEPIQTVEKPQPKKSQEVKTLSVSGIIVSVSGNKVEFQSKNTKSELTLADSVSVISINGSKVEKKNLEYVKKGQNVVFMINESDSEVSTVKVIEGVSVNTNAF